MKTRFSSVEKSRKKKRETNVASSLFYEHFCLFTFSRRNGTSFCAGKRTCLWFEFGRFEQRWDEFDCFVAWTKSFVPKYTFSLKVKYLKRWEMVVENRKKKLTGQHEVENLLRFFSFWPFIATLPNTSTTLDAMRYRFFASIQFHIWFAVDAASKSHITSYLLFLVVWQLFGVDMCSRVALHTKFLVHVTP